MTTLLPAVFDCGERRESSHVRFLLAIANGICPLQHEFEFMLSSGGFRWLNARRYSCVQAQRA